MDHASSGTRTISSFLILLFTLGLTLQLTACGGGGGGGGGTTGGDPNTINANPDPDPVIPPDTDPAPTGWNYVQLSHDRDNFYYDHYGPVVAMNNAGMALVAWTEDFRDTDARRVWVNEYRNGTWAATPTEVAGTGADNPAVTVAADGSAMLVWEQDTTDAIGPNGSTVWARHYDNGAWGSPVQISGSPAEPYSFYAGFPQVGVDALGNAVTIWKQTDNSTGGVNGIFASRYNGTNWTAPELISTSVLYTNFPQLAVAANGDAVVAWPQDTNPYDSGQSGGGPRIPNIWANIFDYSAGTWTGSLEIGSTDLVDYEGTERVQVAMNANGDAAAIWEESRGADDRRIVVNRYDAVNGTWQTAEVINTSTDYLSWPHIDIDANGNLGAVWYATVPDPLSADVNDTIKDGRYRYYDAMATAWTTVETFETSDEDLYDEPLVRFDGAGEAWVSWLQYNSPSLEASVQARGYTPGTGFEQAVNVGSGHELALAVNAPGQVVTATLRTRYSQNPVGFFNSTWAGVHTP